MNEGTISRPADPADTEFPFADPFGPLKTIHVHEPGCGLRGILVIDNVARGPAIGGLRLAPDVSSAECFRLARAMTWKNAAADLPHGGGKSVIFADPAAPAEQKEPLIRAFAAALRGETSYIFGPDMGTNEICMGWVQDEIGRSVGKPRELGGIPLDALGATGYGLDAAAQVAAPYCDLDLAGARVAVQGFGSVGQHAARFLATRGCLLVAAADSKGSLHDPAGLDIAALMALKAEGRSVVDHPRGRTAPTDAILDADCDIWIPAARPDVLRADNVDRLKARLVLEGANIPATPEAEERLHERGIVVVPDFIANAGGVICAAMEYAGATQHAAFDAIDEKITRNTHAVLRDALDRGATPREAAQALATDRVRDAMRLRRWSIF